MFVNIAPKPAPGATEGNAAKVTDTQTPAENKGKGKAKTTETDDEALGPQVGTSKA